VASPRSPVLAPDPHGPTHADALGRIAYEAHFALLRHYSELVFKIRIATVTLTVGAVSLALGLDPGAMRAAGQAAVPGPAASPSLGIGAVLPYVSAWLVSLVYAIEVGYVKRFFQVMVSGRELERRAGLELYFSTYDRPETWPLQLVYGFAVLALAAIAARAAWVAAPGLRSPLLLTLLVAGPLAVLYLSARRLGRYFTALFGPPPPPPQG